MTGARTDEARERGHPALVAAALLVLLGTLSSQSSAAAPAPTARWEVVALGALGGQWSIAVAVNGRGHVVGDADNRSGDSHAFLWQAGRMRDLGTLGGKRSSAVAVNDRGQVVGTSETRTGATQAFFWQDGRMTDLGTLGGKRSSAEAINERGQVVGFAETAAGARHAFLWQDGRMTDLGTLGGEESTADEVNARGQVAGDSTGSGRRRGFLWRSGRMIALSNPPGRTFGYIHDLNDNGAVVGFCLVGGTTARPCLWRSGRGRDLGTLGGAHGRATAVNDRGQVVGRSSIGQPSGKSNAFVWQDGRLYRLPGLRPHDRSSAAAINDAGWIVGESSRTSRTPAQAALWRPTRR